LLAALVLLLAMCLSPVLGSSSPACGTLCPGFAFSCVGTDSGPCCAEVMTNSTTACAYSPYCLVDGYQCCGCVAINKTLNLYHCGGCPSHQKCVYDTPTRIPGTGWHCASGSSLTPHSLFVLAIAIVLFFVFGGV